MRSLFISKFFYRRSAQVLSLKKMLLIFSGPSSGFSIACLLFIILFGFKPYVQRITMRSRSGGRSTRTLVSLGYSFNQQGEITKVLARLPITYFTFLDTTFGVSDIFTNFSTVFTTRYQISSVFYVFFELDFIFNYAFTFLKVFMNPWRIGLVLRGSGVKSATFATLLRSFGWPVI